MPDKTCREDVTKTKYLLILNNPNFLVKDDSDKYHYGQVDNDEANEDGTETETLKSTSQQVHL